MRLSRIVVSVLLSAGAVLAAATAWAAPGGESGWIRTDVLTFDTSLTDSRDSRNHAQFEHEDYTSNAAENEGHGYVSGSTSGPGQEHTYVEVSWHLFDPDKVNNSAKKASQQQSNQVGLRVYTHMTTYSGSTTTFYSPTYSGTTGVDNCSAGTTANSDTGGRDADIDQGGQGTWWVKCHNLDELGLSLPSSVQDKIKALISKKLVDVDKGKVNIKGRERFSP